MLSEKYYEWIYESDEKYLNNDHIPIQKVNLSKNIKFWSIFRRRHSKYVASLQLGMWACLSVCDKIILRLIGVVMGHINKSIVITFANLDHNLKFLVVGLVLWSLTFKSFNNWLNDLSSTFTTNAFKSLSNLAPWNLWI